MIAIKIILIIIGVILALNLICIAIMLLNNLIMLVTDKLDDWEYNTKEKIKKERRKYNDK